ncbi:MAG: MFS transporter [Proteobacteria bacterium]|nr:MFS transporter [Pseudomonadota bacterium]
MAEIAGIGAIGRVLKNRNYRNYTAGNFASQLGMWVQRIAIGWLTWELTKDPKWLGIIAFADFMPNLVFAPLAGALADRMDRLRAIRLYMMISAVLSGAIAWLTIADLITVHYLVMLVLANGIAMSFNFPVRLSIIHGLVGRESLTTAISINAIVFNIARIGGPALAGAVINFWGIGPAVTITVVADILFVLALYCVTMTPPKEPKINKSASNIPAEIMEGFRYVANHPGLGPLLFVLAFYAIFGRPFIDLFPGFADKIFGRGAEALAMLTSVLGVGSFVGSIFLARINGVSGLTRILIANVLLMSVAVIAFAATDIYWVALICTFFAGIAIVMIGVIEQTLLQASVDSAMRGRVLSFYTLIARGCPSLGALLMGYLASYFGLQAPVAAGAVLCIGLWYWAWRRQDALGKALEVTPDSG